MPVGGALELNGEDLRRQPLEARKRALARLLRGTEAGIALNAHYTRPRARSSTSTPARSVAKVSCRSAWAHPIAPAGPTAG